ncbi:MAG: arginine--tRNA ligase [Candidatus Spechtbacterales bacterium]
MAARNTLKTAIKSAITAAQKNGSLPKATVGDFSIERPPRGLGGDYATSVAMKIAALTGKKPKTVAKVLADELAKDAKLVSVFSDIKVAPPGFINFYFAPEYLHKLLAKTVREPDTLAPNVGKGKKLNLEFLSVNPTGELHVGHARTAFYGDALARVLAYAGHNVTREYYINNARQSAQIKELGKTALGRGTSYKSAYLDALLTKYEKQLATKKTEAAAGYFLAGKIQKDIERFLAKKARISFDVWKEEEDLYRNDEVAKTFDALKKTKHAVYEKEGAVWLKTTAYGDTQDQVLVRSNGENTYFMADIAYHRNKAKRADSLVDIWGADHQGHVRRMKAAMHLFGVDKLDILIAQLVRLKGGERLSKRKGNIVTMNDLLDVVGVDSARYFYLTKSLDSQMEFDLELARQHSQKNPVFYIQYTYARICSILEKAEGATSDMPPTRQRVRSQAKSGGGGSRGGRAKVATTPKALAVLSSEGELALAREVSRFSDIVGDIAADYQMHHLTTYTHQLATQFNQFYRDFKVNVEDTHVQQARLALAVVTGMVLKQCLELLGISAPEKL